jgi:hypothetical protein
MEVRKEFRRIMCVTMSVCNEFNFSVVLGSTTASVQNLHAASCLVNHTVYYTVLCIMLSYNQLGLLYFVDSYLMPLRDG